MALNKTLTAEQVSVAVQALTGEKETAEVKADFLAALARKGETTEEIVAFARSLLAVSIPLPLDEETRDRQILDVCGTGGDRLNTFNISTTVALIMAAAGVSVAKHGNRAATSQSGSADVLVALGVKIDLTPEQAAASLRDHQFAFLFAQNYHPAFKQIAPARRLCGERGQRTIFNFLGPLLNPARPTDQLVGVPRRELCVPIADVLQSLGVRRGMVFCGSVMDGGNERYMDELSTLGRSYTKEFAPYGWLRKRRQIGVLTPGAMGFPFIPATLADLAGGDREINAGIVRRILRGEERGPKREAVLLNTAAAMLITGVSGSWAEGWKMAADIIDSGKAGEKLQELITASGRT